MAKDVDRLLRAGGVEYSLCGGSLLGAIRESGFIPWDDDVDIMVDRVNYDRLRAIFAEPRSGYCLRRHLWVDRIQRCDDRRGGLLAATIDIFVMDNCPDNAVLRRLKLLLIMTLQGMMKETGSFKDFSLPYRACLCITHLLGRPFSDETKFGWYQRVSRIGNGKRTRYLTGYNDLFKLLKLRYTNRLFDGIVYHAFEDTSLPITEEFDSYLTTQYGDYMKPPVEEDRVPEHVLI